MSWQELNREAGTWTIPFSAFFHDRFNVVRLGLNYRF
jgi:hypothetical protein